MDSELEAFDVVGLKQVLRALDAGKIKKVILAADAEESIRKTILAKCSESGTELVPGPGMKELGKAAGINVGAAVAGILSDGKPADE